MFARLDTGVLFWYLRNMTKSGLTSNQPPALFDMTREELRAAGIQLDAVTDGYSVKRNNSNEPAAPFVTRDLFAAIDQGWALLAAQVAALRAQSEHERQPLGSDIVQQPENSKPRTTGDSRLLFPDVQAELRALEIRLDCLPGEYRVNDATGSAATAYFTESLEDALQEGRRMAAAHGQYSTQGSCKPAKRRWRLKRMMGKARRRRFIQTHKHRVRRR